MNSEIKRVIVKYNNQIVGYLQELENKEIGFQYSDEWLKTGFSISPISLPLENDVFISKSSYFGGLFGVFSDSLPDGWGGLLINRKLAKEGINYEKMSALTKLTLVSDNGLGALYYEPFQETVNKEDFYDLDKLAIKIKSILDDTDNDENLDVIFALGGASGGARPKAHLRIDEEEWIVKFPSSYDPKNAGVLEYKANQLAEKAGINVNIYKLFSSNICTGYFGVKRFDRTQNRKVHMISLSSLLETSYRIPNLDYAYLFQAIQIICVDKSDIYEAYKRMAFNVFYENKDDHGKNFAFIYDEKAKGYRLSPAYDITKTKNKPEHEMTVLGNGKPKRKDMIDLANEFKLSEMKCIKILDNVRTIINT